MQTPSRPNPLDVLKHIEGMPAYLLMQLEARLSVRIREVYDVEFPGWKENFPGEVDAMAKLICRRLMEVRINEGKQFDSILAASAKAFGREMLNKVLTDIE